MLRRLDAIALALLAACGGAATETARATAVEASPPEALPWCPELPASAQLLVDGGGMVQGVVRDEASRAAISDVTVVATSPALQGSASELTDAQGQYLLEHLPPGNYEVVFYYGEIKVRQGNVSVADGKATPVTIAIDTRATGGETVDITQKAPIIYTDIFPGPADPNDPHGGALWSGHSTSYGQDYTKNVPLAGPAMAAPKCRPRPPEAAKPTPVP